MPRTPRSQDEFSVFKPQSLAKAWLNDVYWHDMRYFSFDFSGHPHVFRCKSIRSNQEYSLLKEVANENTRPTAPYIYSLKETQWRTTTNENNHSLETTSDLTMKIIYRIMLVSSFWASLTISAQATSRLDRAEGHIVLRDDQPCFYISADTSISELPKGILLDNNKSDRLIWMANEITIPDKADTCILLGNRGVPMEPMVLYFVTAGQTRGSVSYARKSFCMAQNPSKKFYLSKIQDEKCTMDPVTEK